MRGWRRAMVLCGVMLGVVVITNGAWAQTGENPTPTTGSSAGDFFVSKVTHADGTQSIDLVGSLMLWVLLTMSVVNVGLIAHLTIANQRKAFMPPAVVEAVKRLLNSGRYKEALDVTTADQSYFSNIMRAALAEASHGFGAMARAMEQAADVHLTTRMRPVEVLYMFGQISPMMGLLGTVYGIIFAFRVFVSMVGHASPSLLAAGIGTALVATFWGLVVAIPALAGYSLLRNKVDSLSLEAMVQAEDLLSQFKPRSQTSKGANASSAGSQKADEPGR